MDRKEALLVCKAIHILLCSLNGLYDTIEEGHDTLAQASHLVNLIGLDLEAREDW